MSEAMIFGTTVPSFRLFISLLISYPICILFNTHLMQKSNTIKHLYYLFCGLSLVYFNFGLDLIHSLINCLFCYFVLKLISIKYAIVINFLVPLIYLLYGCYANQIGSDYSIKWTLPQCVLTLRLIAVSFDVYDGIRNQKFQKSDNKKDVERIQNTDTAITSFPTVIQFLSHCYFPGSILVGPLISYQTYINYINSNVNHLNNSWKLSIKRLVIGLFYLFVFQLGSHYWPIDYLTSEQFSNSGFWSKVTAMAIVTKVCMSKYLMSWQISEGACIASGVAFDGKTYDGCANVNIIKFETTATFGGIIKSFNLTTNSFAAKYIFKRLKFFGNRTVSQGLTLLFLAIWHGLETGYLATFMLEFLVMKMEVEVINKVSSLCLKYNALNQVINSSLAKWTIYLIFRIYTFYLLGYCFVPFMLLQTPLWYQVYKDVYFYGHLITMSWPLINLFI